MTSAAGSWSGMRKRAPRESISSPTAATNVTRQSSGISTAPPATASAQQGLFASTEPRPMMRSSVTANFGPPGTVSMWLRSTSSLSPLPRVAMTEPAPSMCAVSQPKRGRRSQSMRAAFSSWRVGLGTATMSMRRPTDSGKRIRLFLPLPQARAWCARISRRPRRRPRASRRRRAGSARPSAQRGARGACCPGAP